nr:MAG TPA: hypothetical protein [Caudoviricetes sp.]
MWAVFFLFVVILLVIKHSKTQQNPANSDKNKRV